MLQVDVDPAEDAHGLLFCLLHFAAIGSAFWLWLHPEVTGFVTPLIVRSPVTW